MDTRSTVPSAPDSRPSYVGKYEVLGELDRGGQGVVYRAKDPNLPRHVALKAPLPQLAGDRSRRDFVKAARLAARVAHEHLVPIYDVFEVDGVPWIAMELVEGRSLRQLIQSRGRLSIEDVMRIGEEIASALQAVHGAGLLHRDIKPGNIMLTTSGSARLMDFGLVIDSGDEPRNQDGISTESAGSQLLPGTLGYASPEQLLGRPLSASSDLFSLGAVLSEALTGRRAFAGDSPGALFDATLHAQPTAIRGLVRDAPDELVRIVSKCLAKKPDERYQSARDLRADLLTLRRRLEGPVVAPVASPAQRPRVLVAAIGAVTLAAVIAYGLAMRPFGLRLAAPQQLTTSSGWEADPAISPDGSLVAYTSNESGNTDLWLLDIEGGGAVQLTDDAALDRSPRWLPDGSAILFASNRSGRQGIWSVPKLGGAATRIVDNAEDPAPSPDGTRIAFSQRDGHGEYRIGLAALRESSNSVLITTSDHGTWDHRRPSWSPDGTSLVYQAQNDLWVISADGSSSRRLTTDGAPDREPQWSPDGRWIYFSSTRGGSRGLWRVPAGRGPAERLTAGQGPERQPSVSVDRTRLVFSTYVDNPNLVLRDRNSGMEIPMSGERVERSPVFSPDGRALVFVSDRWASRGDLWLQPLGGDGPEGPARRLTDQEGSVSQPAFSPDGEWIAYHRVVQGQRDIWAVPSAGGPAVQITSGPAQELQPEWAPDAKSVTFVSNVAGKAALIVQGVQEGRPMGRPRQLVAAPNLSSPSWSPDGSTIAFESDDEVWLVQASGGAAARRLTTGAGALRVCWDRRSNVLWASGTWGEGRISLRTIDLTSGTATASPSAVVLGTNAASSDFDLSWDGRWVAFAREEVRGDLWLQRLISGRF